MRSEAAVCVKLVPGKACINVSSDRKSRADSPFTARCLFGTTAPSEAPAAHRWPGLDAIAEPHRSLAGMKKASFLDVCVIDQPKVEVKRNNDERAWMKECSQPLSVLHEGEAGAPFVASSDFSASVGSVRNCPRFI